MPRFRTPFLVFWFLSGLNLILEGLSISYVETLIYFLAVVRAAVTFPELLISNMSLLLHWVSRLEALRIIFFPRLVTFYPCLISILLSKLSLLFLIIFITLLYFRVPSFVFMFISTLAGLPLEFGLNGFCYISIKLDI